MNRRDHWMSDRRLTHCGKCLSLARQTWHSAEGYKRDDQRSCTSQSDHDSSGTELLFLVDSGYFGLLCHRASCEVWSFLPWINVNIKGTKKSVAKVATLRPPITARASGAFCSPPSPIPNAIGIMPMIMAKAVMMMGRRRV